nr:hypothetical protein [Sulfolobus islandicus]
MYRISIFSESMLNLLLIKNIGPFYYFSNNVTASLPYSVGKYVLGLVGIDSLDPKVISEVRESWHLAMDKVKTQSSLISKVIISPITIQQYFNFTEAYNHGYNGNDSDMAIEGVPSRGRWGERSLDYY